MDDEKLDFEQRQQAVELEERVIDDPEWAASQIVGLRSRCERLEAALPKTRDGVAVVPGMALYTRNYNDIIKVEPHCAVYGPEPIEGRRNGYYYVASACYSTREAAAAAKEPTDA